MRVAFARLRLPTLGHKRVSNVGKPQMPALSTLRSGMVRWLDARPSRDRLLLIALAACAAAVVFVTLVWQPIEDARAAALADIVRYDRFATRLRAAGPDVARMTAARTGTPSTLITESAAKAGLTIQRIEPQGANIGVTLDDAGFDALLGWLAAVERNAGLRVVDLKLERRPNLGTVSVQVTLAGT